MNKNFLLLFSAILAGSLHAQTIADARQQPVGTVVTVRGIVTNGSELGSIRYLQDQTAGLAAFPGSGSAPGFADAVKPGDSISVTGPLADFNGLLEISPIQSFTVIASGLPLPAPKALNSLLEADESLEGQLVSVPCVAFANAGAAFSNSGTYDVSDSEGNVSIIFLRSGHPLLGTTTPTGRVLMTAIVSQFFQLQLLPRSASDLEPSPCFYFTENLNLTDLQQNSLSFSWKTNLTSPTFLLYGTDPQPGTLYENATPANAHSAVLNNLNPGTLYRAQAIAVHNGDTIRTPVRTFATVSNSSGRIKVFFNHPIDESTASPYLPDGVGFDACLQEIFNRIDSACCTIDVSHYNNNRSDIVNRLTAAQARGVRVRYVAALNGNSLALQPPPPFPVLYGNALDLMHNKFMVCDAEQTDRAWVVTGSMNWTTDNMQDDFNNMLSIQDESLARGYVAEFEEMWGSQNAQPDTLLSRFGLEKTDNTPRDFRIGGIPVECLFSPSDGTTAAIVDAVETGSSSLVFALLTFTRDELGDAVLAAQSNGALVRGLIENTGDQGTEFNRLMDNGVQVFRHVLPGAIHHKYAVADADDVASDPLVVTGSHNWSSQAEDRNDENTLILHDARLARLFQGEFERRWVEISTRTTNPGHAAGWTLYPNPACSSIQIVHAGSAPAGLVSYRIFDASGALQGSGISVGQPFEAPVEQLPEGWYLLELRSEYGHSTVSFQRICR